MITISREQFPYAAYLRVIAIRRNAEENSDSTWATLDDLGAITKVGTDTVIVKTTMTCWFFGKTEQFDWIGMNTLRTEKETESLKAALCSARHKKTALILAKTARFTPKMTPSLCS